RSEARKLAVRIEGRRPCRISPTVLDHPLDELGMPCDQHEVAVVSPHRRIEQRVVLALEHRVEAVADTAARYQSERTHSRPSNPERRIEALPFGDGEPRR